MEPSCPSLKGPKWGTVSIEYDNTVGHFVAKYTCDEGLVMRGDYQRYCLDDGKWTGREPFCLQGEFNIAYKSAILYLHKFTKVVLRVRGPENLLHLTIY